MKSPRGATHVDKAGVYYQLARYPVFNPGSGEEVVFTAWFVQAPAPRGWRFAGECFRPKKVRALKVHP